MRKPTTKPQRRTLNDYEVSSRSYNGTQYYDVYARGRDTKLFTVERPATTGWCDFHHFWRAVTDLCVVKVD